MHFSSNSISGNSRVAGWIWLRQQDPASKKNFQGENVEFNCKTFMRGAGCRHELFHFDFFRLFIFRC